MACRRLAGKLARDRQGAASVEYGFLMALVFLAVMGAIRLFAQTNLDIWNNVAAKVVAAG